MTEVVRYTVTDDFGNLLNPMLAEGQVHGGVAQGIGQAITERVVYDDNGQLLTASFMDYALPRAEDLPMFGFTTEPVPSKANQLGMKGCGEAGTVGALAAVSNAVADAVWERGVRDVQMPFTPLTVWEMLGQVRLPLNEAIRRLLARFGRTEQTRARPDGGVSTTSSSSTARCRRWSPVRRPTPGSPTSSCARCGTGACPSAMRRAFSGRPGGPPST